MTFYLIGLGLNEKSAPLEALDILKSCKKIYLENYTVEFPYKIEELEKTLKIKISELGREKVESEEFIEDAKKDEIALLVYGAPLAATTHISLVLKCKKEKIKCRIIENASIFDAVGETGLQMYKFGRTASMPMWSENYSADSFADIIRGNLKMKAHTLLLVDIGLKLEKAKEQLRTACGNHKIFLDKIILCSRIGSEKGRIYYDKIDNLPEKIESPFCFIIPSELHFLEKEALETLREK